MQYPQCIDPSRDAVPLFEYRRPTRDWLGACLFRLIDRGFDAVLLRAGDTRRGTVLFVLVGHDALCRHYTQVRLSDGRVVWARAGGGTAPVRSAVLTEAAIRRDPDIWICRIGAAGFHAWSSAEAEMPSPPGMTVGPAPDHGMDAFA